MKSVFRPSILVAISCLGLAACGGGGGGSTPLAISQTPDGRILAGSQPIVPNDFVGRTFPLQYAAIVVEPSGARLGASTGTIRVVDANTIVITGELENTFRRRANSNEFADDSGDVVLTVEDFGAARYVFNSASRDPIEFRSSYGFETPVALRPVSARYRGRSAESVILVTDSGFGAIVDARDSVDLRATFNGSGGSIRGVLLDGSRTVDFNGNGDNDRLFVRTELNGAVTAGGFVGTVSGAASISVDSGTPVDLNLNVANSSATGKFFGPAADLASGTYITQSATSALGSAQLSGFFIATKQ
jgi:hypothetical protein